MFGGVQGQQLATLITSYGTVVVVTITTQQQQPRRAAFDVVVKMNSAEDCDRRLVAIAKHTQTAVNDSHRCDICFQSDIGQITGCIRITSLQQRS